MKRSILATLSLIAITVASVITVNATPIKGSGHEVAAGRTPLKCNACNGTGWKGQWKCTVCGGDGDLNN